MGIDVGQLIVSILVGVAAGIIAGVIVNKLLKKSPKLALGVAICIFIIVGFVAVVFNPAIVLVDVPYLEDRSKDEAVFRLQERGLIPDFTEQYHDTVPKGRVIYQDLDPGLRVEKGTVILFIVSKGPSLGFISAESTPSDANVYLDGTYRGTAPMIISDVPPGDHIVKITKSGYEEWSKSISVTGGDTSSISASLSVLPTPTPTMSPTPSVPGQEPKIALEMRDNTAYGTVTGVSNYDDYRVVVYVETDRLYVQPFVDPPSVRFRIIESDGSWECPGMHIAYGGIVRAFLIEEGSNAPSTLQVGVEPDGVVARERKKL